MGGSVISLNSQNSGHNVYVFISESLRDTIFMFTPVHFFFTKHSTPKINYKFIIINNYKLGGKKNKKIKSSKKNFPGNLPPKDYHC